MTGRPTGVFNWSTLVALATFVVATSTACTNAHGRDEADENSHRPESSPVDFTREWQEQIPGLSVEQDEKNGAILMWDADSIANGIYNIRSFDVATGKVRWQSPAPYGSPTVDYIRDHRVSGDVIVTGWRTQSGKGVGALHLADGTVAWRITTPMPYAAVGKTLVIVQWSKSEIRAFDTQTGDQRWVATTSSECDITGLAASWETYARTSLCSNGDRFVEGLGPTDGRVAWRATLPRNDEAIAFPVSAENGVVAVETTRNSMTLFGQHGERLFESSPTDKVGQGLLGADGIVAIIDHIRGETQMVSAIRVDTGDVAWSKPFSLSTAKLTDGRIVGLGALPQPLLPTAFYRVDLATGAYSTSVAPVLGDGLAFVGEGFIVVRSGRSLVRYAFSARPTPSGFAGGAAADDWPSACDLISNGEMASLTSDNTSYIGYPVAVTFGGDGLPGPISCRFAPSPITGSAVEVSIAWVSADVQQGERIISAVAALGTYEAVFGIGDFAGQARLDYSSPPRNAGIVKVGRIIATAIVDGNGIDILKLLSAIAANLAGLGGTR